MVLENLGQPTACSAKSKIQFQLSEESVSSEYETSITKI